LIWDGHLGKWINDRRYRLYIQSRRKDPTVGPSCRPLSKDIARVIAERDMRDWIATHGSGGKP
jgi:hypothetical protein